MLEAGSQAPDFELEDAQGIKHTLSEFKGRKVALYFYPRDNTPGCTRQACAFGNAYQELSDKNITVIGISKDSAASHANFIEKYNLPFLLLSDPEHKVIEQYGMWQEKKMYGKVSFGTVRSCFLIDEEGIIVKIFKKVKPDDNAALVLEFWK